MSEAFGRIEEARKTIASLVERYARNRDRYRVSTYNEETCRAEFITPLFEGFGWDVTNKAGYAEQYKDVIHEEGIKVGDFTKAPDYTFRIAGVRKFFVEAKKPFVDLKSDPDPAYQLRRYAWSAKLPLSILTDFEEFAVYDTRIRPKEGDKPSVGRILYHTYDDLLPKLDDLWAIFSKDAVLKGSFDRYAEDTQGKRGTSEVDAEFLLEIEGWRDELARNIAIRNEDLSVDDLNFAVQATIDRVILLRIAEGRGVEPYGSLLGLVNAPEIYKRLVALYRKADARYNSGLFDFRADRLTPGLTIDDKVLKPILQNLYYPKSPYEFSVLPAEILGNVYEQFLGKVIRLTKGHHAVVEEKPEVKKAGGVYYTPAYIVDYIVKQTVGKLCEGKSVKQMEKLRILDPACGSGSFLLRAYQELLDHHLAWYREHEPKKRQKEVFLGPGGDWRLTTAEKHRIVLNNIYGVDIDRQAVEVTKLSLLLKVLEGENEETIRQQNLFGERALPSLEGNIKCGNSLIAPKDLGELVPDPEELRRINPFPWADEFPSAFKSGGFDVVVGNPPYIRIQTMQEWAPREVELYKSLFRSASSGNYDIYVVFVEKGLSILKPDGYLGFIMPQKFWQVQFGAPLRGFLSEGRHVGLIANFRNNQVFEAAFINTAILVLRSGVCREFKYVEIPKVTSNADLPKALFGAKESIVASSAITAAPWILKPAGILRLLQKLREGRQTLSEATERIFQGLKTSADKIYVLDLLKSGREVLSVRSPQTDKEFEIEAAICHPLLKGTEMRPFVPLPHRRVILFPYESRPAGGAVALMNEERLRGAFPRAWLYLSENRGYLENREAGRMRGPRWFGYIYPKALDIMGLPKLLTPDLAPRASFLLDEKGDRFILGGAAGGYGLLPRAGVDSLFLLGLLNSRLLSFFATVSGQQMESGYYSFEARFIRDIPIDDGSSEKRSPTDLVGLVRRMLSTRKAVLVARTAHDRTNLERQVEAIASAIDRLVYELYGLSPEEIGTVEATART